uniref:Methyltransferase type 11 domain-containing protein n=1 Tax=viral metagenome TaxID=1070528 RepID=A0A6C0BRM9_9ZZZZ
MIYAYKKYRHNTYMEGKVSICETYVIYVIIMIVIISYYIFIHKPSKESFKSIGTITLKKNEDIYDDFYISVYDDLLHDDFRCDWEIGYMVKVVEPGNDIILLDIGSGTGNTVDTCVNIGINAIGIDKSKAMVNYSNKKFPNHDFKTGDILNSMIFDPEKFDIITCFYFTIYYIKNKRLFFDNCIKFLKPGGHIVLHLVDRDKFDTLLPSSNPLYMISPQDYATKRITRSVGKFENHDYVSDFVFNGSNVTFVETFTDKKTKDVRKHELSLYMETQKEILEIARSVGFILLSSIEMKHCGHTEQYLYVLQKPR